MIDKTFKEILSEAEKRLKAANVPDPRFDARALVMDAFKLEGSHYLSVSEDKPSDLIPRYFKDEGALKKAAETFEENLSRREGREPLQQILGSAWFYGFEFKVTKDVLCPRADTETLIDTVLGSLLYDNLPAELRERKDLVDRLTTGKQIVEKEDAALLDLCTGTGCIAITLCKTGHFSRVEAVDISEEALKIATYNKESLLTEDEKCRFKLYRSDMFSEVEGRFDLIVSNPPYIPSKVVDTLEPEVREYEPRIALDGTEDGLRFYRILAEESPKYLNPGGHVAFEIGYDQGEVVAELLKTAGFRDVMVIKDYGGNDRVVTGHL
ncbi:release factor glutamine methyltransferase [Oribacterium sp. KHPX15]|uniref:peptide chain release factor N(5)-glutamine methyltransferase n=1 Tax=Oribacterium sp. KHPX15 TaxID=1855342 RepID=UPI000894C1E4|nr:peptide chain release factor N(5)-glutamine methyltransferase [Oribacterium sp. KHPX15]SEA45638.1 release factor glutamine methyltransferase [Oribacterium sp. KHPX15]